MNHPIYFLTTFIIGSVILLFLVRINIHTNEFNYEALTEEIIFRELVTTQDILDYYLKKIGFRSTDKSILVADSQYIKFTCDDDNDGNLDTLEIKLVPDLMNSENPSDGGLQLIKNGDAETIIPSGITEFNIRYLDENFNEVNHLVFIKILDIRLKLESNYPVKGDYLFNSIRFFVKPKNLI